MGEVCLEGEGGFAWRDGDGTVLRYRRGGEGGGCLFGRVFGCAGCLFVGWLDEGLRVRGEAMSFERTMN